MTTTLPPLPDDILITADEISGRLQAQMATNFKALEEHRDVERFADEMGCVGEEIAMAILAERNRCARIIIEEATKHGELHAFTRIAGRIRKG